MKSIYIVPEVPLTVLFDEQNGSYEVLKLNVSDVPALIENLRGVLRLHGGQHVRFEVVEPEPLAVTIPQKQLQEIAQDFSVDDKASPSPQFWK